MHINAVWAEKRREKNQSESHSGIFLVPPPPPHPQPGMRVTETAGWGGTRPSSPRRQRVVRTTREHDCADRTPPSSAALRGAGRAFPRSLCVKREGHHASSLPAHLACRLPNPCRRVPRLHYSGTLASLPPHTPKPWSLRIPKVNPPNAAALPLPHKMDSSIQSFFYTFIFFSSLVSSGTPDTHEDNFLSTVLYPGSCGLKIKTKMEHTHIPR